MRTARLPLVLGALGVGLLWVVSAAPVWSGDSAPSPPKLLRRTIDYFSRSGRTASYVSPAPVRRTESDKVRSAKEAVPPAPEPVRQSVGSRVRPFRRSPVAGESHAGSSRTAAPVDPFTSGEAGQAVARRVPKDVQRFRELFSSSKSTVSQRTPSQTARRSAPADSEPPFEPADHRVVHAVHKTTHARSGRVEPVSEERPVADRPTVFPWADAHEAKPSDAVHGDAQTAGTDSQPRRGSPGVPLPSSRLVHHDTAVVGATSVVTRTVSEIPAPAKAGQPASASELPLELAAPAVKNFSDAAPQVRLRWVKLSPVTVGRPCKIDLVVVNEGQAAADHVTVVAYFPPLVRLTRVEPEPVEATDHLTWRLESLAAGEQKTFHVELIPVGRGELDVTAVARLTQSSSASFQVEEPLLALELKGPKEVLVGDPAPQLVVVSNPGTGVVHDVVLEAVIPEGLEHPRGKHLMMNVGSLAPGESRMVRLSLAAVAGGEKTLELRARASDGLEQSARTTIHVLAPSLKVAVEGPSLRYVGRHATYKVTVTNDGGAATNNVQATYELPEGFAFEQADTGGSFDPDTRLVRWFIGRLEPGESRTLQVQVTAAKLGQFTHKVAVTCEQGVNVEGQTVTRVDGTPSLTLQVVDLDDPVEVGRQTQYEIRVSNDGTKEATNVALACELPDGVELVGAKGATPYKLQERTVQFQPLPALPPGKTALFRLQVRGTAAGTHRLRAQIFSDSVEAPLVVDELTKFYSE